MTQELHPTATPTWLAIDFGTSNSLLAAASADAVFPPAPLDLAASDPTVLRSALYFKSLDEFEFGARAPRALVENGFSGRLIRSIKRHLPSKSFTHTTIGHRQATLEDLVGKFLAHMRHNACDHYRADVRSVVLGRPARFSNDAEEDRLAEERLERAARIAGFERIAFCPEPVAAAYDFAADLEEPRLVLVADLGGGTSDFTLVSMSREGFDAKDVLAGGGVSVAGDAFDGALTRASVARHFGSEARYRVPFGKNELTMPATLVEMLASPADLTLADRSRTMKMLDTIRGGLTRAEDRPKLERFEALVEDGLGFSLYEGVEGAKRRLSDEDRTVLAVADPSIAVEQPVTRSELEACSRPKVEAILASLDRTLEAAGAAADDVEIVCFTGGTSRMPLVANAIAERLPRAGARRLASFHSVVLGLSRRARALARGAT